MDREMQNIANLTKYVLCLQNGKVLPACTAPVGLCYTEVYTLSKETQRFGIEIESARKPCGIKPPLPANDSTDIIVPRKVARFMESSNYAWKGCVLTVGTRHYDKEYDELALRVESLRCWNHIKGHTSK